MPFSFSKWSRKWRLFLRKDDGDTVKAKGSKETQPEERQDSSEFSALPCEAAGSG